MECENRCCGRCIAKEFTGHPNAEAGPSAVTATGHDHAAHLDPQSFLLLHHIYCLKNGRPSVALRRGLQQHAHRRAPKGKLKAIAS